jgi:hypothetical protein
MHINNLGIEFWSAICGWLLRAFAYWLRQCHKQVLQLLTLHPLEKVIRAFFDFSSYL